MRTNRAAKTIEGGARPVATAACAATLVLNGTGPFAVTYDAQNNRYIVENPNSQQPPAVQHVTTPIVEYCHQPQTVTTTQTVLSPTCPFTNFTVKSPIAHFEDSFRRMRDRMDRFFENDSWTRMSESFSRLGQEIDNSFAQFDKQMTHTSAEIEAGISGQVPADWTLIESSSSEADGTLRVRKVYKDAQGGTHLYENASMKSNSTNAHVGSQETAAPTEPAPVPATASVHEVTTPASFETVQQEEVTA